MAKTNVIDDFQGLQSIRNHLKATLPLYQTEVTLTTAEILALFTTPIELIAAPGAGLIVVPRLVYAFLDYNAAAYAGIATNEDIAIRYTNASGAIAATIETTGFLDLTADALRIAEADLDVAIAPVANAAIVAHMTTANIITGDSPVSIRTYYNIIPSAFGATV